MFFGDAVIKQIYVASYFGKSFRLIMVESGLMHEYNDSSKPAFFFGLAIPEALEVLVKHKSFAVIVSTGGDTNNERPLARKMFEFCRKHKDRISFVAPSYFAVRAITRQGFPSPVVFPFAFINEREFKPVQKGNGVLLYGFPHQIYHNDQMFAVEKLFPHLKFIYVAHMGNDNSMIPTPFMHVNRADLVQKIYPRCFICVRLTEMDGTAFVVQELGLMGIRCVWNGGGPSAIPWKTVDDVVDAIKREEQEIGRIDDALSRRMKDHVSFKPKHFRLETYFPHLASNLPLAISTKNKSKKILVLGLRASNFARDLRRTYTLYDEENELSLNKNFVVVDAFQESEEGLAEVMDQHSTILINSVLATTLCDASGKDSAYTESFVHSKDQWRRRIGYLKSHLSGLENTRIGFWVTDHHQYTFSGGHLGFVNCMKDVGVSLLLPRYLHTQEMVALANVMVSKGLRVDVAWLPLHVGELSASSQDRRYDIFVYGEKFVYSYPFRARLFNLLQNSTTNLTFAYCDKGKFYVKVGGRGADGIKDSVCFGPGLTEVLRRSWITVVTPGKSNYWVAKYFEVAFAGSVLLGPIPTDAKLLLSSNDMINVEDHMSDNEIMFRLLDAWHDKRKLALKSKAMLEKLEPLSRKHYARNLLAALEAKTFPFIPPFLIKNHLEFEQNLFLKDFGQILRKLAK